MAQPVNVEFIYAFWPWENKPNFTTPQMSGKIKGARREEKNRFRYLLIDQIKQKKKDFLKFMIYDPD